MNGTYELATTGADRNAEKRGTLPKQMNCPDAHKYPLSANIMTTLASSQTVRVGLSFLIVAAFTLVVRPSVPIAVALLVAAGIYIGAYNREAPFGKVFQSGFLSAGPYVGLFVLASLVAVPTAFDAGNHGIAFIKILLLHLVVIFCFCVGRLIGPIDVRTLMHWSFCTLAVAAVILVEEQQWSLIRNAVFSQELVTLHYTWILNRSFLLLSLGLAFFLVTAKDLRSHWMVGTSLVLMLAIFAVTESESARLAIAVSLLVLCMTENIARGLLTLSIAGAIVAMLVGPFVYDLILKTWETNNLRGFMEGTIHARLMVWANFSALILDSDFLGRGLRSAKLLDRDPSLYPIPYAFSALHPHNAGLQVTADLGFVGIAWFSLVLWRIRTYVLSLEIFCIRGLIAVLVAFLAISFVADGFWQSRWWFAGAILALWVGILVSNPDKPAGYA
ncbi:MAG: O-antigen ligase family protein [Hyphomicrobiaceae bacterium]